MNSELGWKVLPLKKAGVTLIDCDHKTPEALDEGYPYVAIPQLKDGHIKLDEVRRISHSDFESWTKKLRPQANDVIVVRRCNSGESAHVPDGLQCAIGQNLVVLRADGTKVLPQYLRWLVRGSEWWDEVSKYINVGAVFDSLRCRDIPNFELPIPPVEEQREISSVLAALDDRITLLRETNVTLEAFAQALFKSWFIDFDPVRAKMEGRAPEGMDGVMAALFPDVFDESGLGAVPRGWKHSTVGDSFILTMGQSPPGNSYNTTGDGLPFYQGRTDFGFRFPTQRICCAAPTRFAEVGDTLVSVRAPVGDVNMAIESCCIGRGVASVRHPIGYRGFTFYAIKGLGERFKTFDSEGTIFGSINKKDFQSLPIIAPPSDVLSAYNSVSSSVDDRIVVNEKKVRTLTKLRDTLLPRLISGQLRLPETIEALKAA